MTEQECITEQKTTDSTDQFEPRIVGFLCNWCSYAGADLAGTSRIQYPPNVRVIRVMCSGRVNPLFVAKCFAEGADGVLVSGCHIGDCHYLEGNYLARRRFVIIKWILEYLGIEPERFRMSWVSASEGGRFAEIVTKIVDEIKALGPIKKFNRGIDLEALKISKPEIESVELTEERVKEVL
jgi:coenzyme F420-reducing hydrogenase delta subunit